MENMLDEFLAGKFAVRLNKADINQIKEFYDIVQPHIRRYPDSTIYNWSSLWDYISSEYSGPCHYTNSSFADGGKGLSGAGPNYCMHNNMLIISAETFIYNIVQLKPKPIQENEFWNILTG